MASNNIFTIKEAAEYLKCHKATVYRLIKEGKIKAVKFSQRNIRIVQSDLDDYLLEIRKKH